MAQDFYYILGMREGSGQYTAENPITHYLGKYQLGEDALTDIGYYKKDGTVTLDWKGQWTGKNGVWSKADFLANGTVQEEAIREYHAKVWGYIKSINIAHYAGQTVNGHKITVAGMIAGAHLVGAGNLKKFLLSGGDIVPGDASGTQVIEYLELLKDCTTKYDGDYTGGNNTFKGGSGLDIFSAGIGNDILIGEASRDILLGDNDSDVLYGGAGEDTLIGGDNDNASYALFGGSGEDVLLDGGGDDTLAGGDASNLYAEKELDYLAGGVGHDIYYVSHQDIINDADSTGFIMFNSKAINGKKTKVDEYTYEDANFTYTLDGSNLIVVDKNLGEYITIENFQNSAMGITLDNGNGNGNNSKKDIELYVGDATVTEGGTLEFTIGIDNTLNKDLVVNVSSYFNGSASSSDLSGTTSGTIIIKAGTTYGTFEIATLDDTMVEPTENFIFAVTGLSEAYAGDDMNSFLIKNAGEGTIIDDDAEGVVTIEVDDISVNEGDTPNQSAQVTVSLSSALKESIHMTFGISVKNHQIQKKVA